VVGKNIIGETVVILQLGAKESSISIVHAGYPYVIRSLSIPQHLTEAIANYHQCDWLKARHQKTGRLKNWKPDATQKEEDTSAGTAALSSQLENLVLEVEQTFKIFTNS